MDPFDEFEFKPLTDGLGFQKRAKRLKEEVQSSRLRSQNQIPTNAPDPLFNPTSSQRVSGSRTSRVNDIISSLPEVDFLNKSGQDEKTSSSQSAAEQQDLQNVQLEEVQHPHGTPAQPRPQRKRSARERIQRSTVRKKSPLQYPAHLRSSMGQPPDPRRDIFARKESVNTPEEPVKQEEPSPAPSKHPLKARINTPVLKTRQPMHHSPAPESAKSVETGQPAGILKWRSTTIHPGAAIFDLVVVTGMALLFLVALLVITNTNLSMVTANLDKDFMTQVSFGLLLFSVIQLYMILTRTFFGATFGEWAFDIQLGTEQQQKRLIYPLQVVWRSLIVTFTGVITLPFLSLLFRRDLAVYLTGLELFREDA